MAQTDPAQPSDAPRPTVAIVGASTDPGKYSNKAVRAYLQQGYEVYPINPKGGTLHGLKVYRSLRDVPRRPLDRVSVYVPPQITLQILDEVAEVGTRELWLNPGSESPEVLEKAKQLGLEPIVACSILAVGLDPEKMPPA